MEAVVFILFMLFFAAMVIVPVGLLIWAIVDLLKRPAWAWQATGQQQVVWVLVVLLASVIGPIIYLVVARPKLDEAERRGAPLGPAPPPAPGSVPQVPQGLEVPPGPEVPRGPEVR